jgi:hypothetical protein
VRASNPATNLLAVLLGVAFVVASLATPAVAVAAEPCAGDTPSAVRFYGLPERIPIGHDERFALEPDDPDWELAGGIHVTMQSGGEVFFDDTTNDPYADLWLRLDRGDTEATVTAAFEQWEYFNDVTCTKTIVRTVSGFVAPVRLICNRWDRRGENIAYRTRKPKRCSIWRSNWAHYQSASFIKARWRGWGKPRATARATLVYNMGYRARVRVRAYRLRLDCTRRFYVYTRVFIRGPDGQGVVRPDVCA